MALHDIARVTVTVGGTGSITLGAAVPSFNDLVTAGVGNGETVTYAIEDLTINSREIGRGSYNTSTKVFTRSTILASTNSGNPINCTTQAQLFVTVAAEDVVTLATPTGLVGLTANPGTSVTAIRSDGAPALDQSITPTWTGTHSFASTSLPSPSSGNIAICGQLASVGGITSGGALYTTAGSGLSLSGFGSGNDIVLRNKNSSPALLIPSGTQNIVVIGTITSGAVGVASGMVVLNGSTSGNITIQAEAVAGTYNFNLPITAGTAGQFLTSQAGGASAMTWTTPANLRFVITGVNFNSANTDNAITITLPGGISRYAVNSVRISNASASISTATIGVFTATGGLGQTIAANQAITVTATATDTNNNTMSLTLTNGNTEAYNDSTLQVRIGTAQGSTATADVIINISPLT